MHPTDILPLTNAYLAPTYARYPIALATGSGALLTDTQNKTYIDMGSGIAVNVFGVNDPLWQNAVTRQVFTLQHASNYYYTAPQARLAELLHEKTGMQRVFFGNSGAEANECAIKTARKHYCDTHGDPDAAPVLLTLENSFHGRTITTLSATGQDTFHHHFAPFTQGFVHLPANDIPALEAAFAEYPVCGILMELIQGEGGVVEITPEYAHAAQSLCQKHDALFMLDEVQTGIGHTGSLFAYQQYDLSPDVVTAAKGLGGGLPIGAALLFDRAKDTLGAGSHGSTFGGNPVCCAGAVSIVERMTDSLLGEVTRKGLLIREIAKTIPDITAVSGKGLMLGLSTKKDAHAVAAKCLELGALVLTAKEKLRLLPPLTITDAQIAEGMAILKKALEACAA